MPPSRRPSLAEVVNRAVARGQAELRVSMPVVVVSYDAGKQTVCVQPLISDFYEDQDGVTQFEDLPQINGVLVQAAAGGKMRITMPIQKDDTGVVLISDRAIDLWAKYGGKQSPKDRRTHHIADAVYIPGVSPVGRWANAATDVITIGDDGQAGAMVARVADPVQAATTMATWVGAVTTGLNGLAPGSCVQPTDFGTIQSGSSTVKILG